MTIETKMLPLATKTFEKSKLVAAKDGATLDPSTILIIIQILVKVVEIFWDWYNKDEDKMIKSSGKLNILKKWILWKVVLKYARNRKEAKYIYDAICALVYEFTEEERKIIFDAVKSEVKQ